LVPDGSNRGMPEIRDRIGVQGGREPTPFLDVQVVNKGEAQEPALEEHVEWVPAHQIHPGHQRV
jgi:hypothetical protein